MSISLEEKFLKHFQKLRWFHNEVEVSFDIEDFKIDVSLYSDQKPNISKEKRDLDVIAQKTRLHKAGWSTDSKVVTRLLEFNYSDVLFDRSFRYISTFEFVLNHQANKTNSDTEFDIDWQFDNNEPQKLYLYLLKTFLSAASFVVHFKSSQIQFNQLF